MHFAPSVIVYRPLNDRSAAKKPFFCRRTNVSLCVVCTVLLIITPLIVALRIKMSTSQNHGQVLNDRSNVSDVVSSNSPVRRKTTLSDQSPSTNHVTAILPVRNTPSSCPIPFDSIWDMKGVIVAGYQSKCNSDSYSLCQPSDIFLDEANHKLYIADTENDRIQMYSLLTTDNPPVGVTVASQGLIRPTGIFVDSDTGDMYILDYSKNETVDLRDSPHYRVHLWHTNDVAGEILVDEQGEYGYQPSSSKIVLDKELNIYISTRFHIRKCPSSIRYKHCIIIAGLTEQNGNTLNDLSSPSGFYLDHHLTLFILDVGNKRIQRWFANATAGERLVKTGTYTAGITLDCYERIYWGAHTAIFRYDLSNNETKMIAGGNVDLLWAISALTFDQLGNLFVADSANHRIKKFLIL